MWELRPLIGGFVAVEVRRWLPRPRPSPDGEARKSDGANGGGDGSGWFLSLAKSATSPGPVDEFFRRVGGGRRQITACH